jgi:hypothetical protein
MDVCPAERGSHHPTTPVDELAHEVGMAKSLGQLGRVGRAVQQAGQAPPPGGVGQSSPDAAEKIGVG